MCKVSYTTTAVGATSETRTHDFVLFISVARAGTEQDGRV